MTSDALEKLRAQLREIDRGLLRALAARAGFPRHPWPVFPCGGIGRSCPPPLDEILLAISPAGTAAETAAAEAANRDLVAALVARQETACRIADAKLDLLRADAQAALETGDRGRMAALLADLPAELGLLDFIRTAAAEFESRLPGDLAPFLWREYVIPWTQRSELAHLLDP